MLYYLLTCIYLQMTDDNIHWFSIINSFVIVVFLTGIVALIMLRILRKDFARYNELALSEVNPNLLFLYGVFCRLLKKITSKILRGTTSSRSLR